jgi:NAD(P)-dependent dehydrogenase (short-subunit alcohol dehydrogenase family)
LGALDGKVAVVTGAGRGIGRGEAMLLAAEGARVVVNDLGGEWDGTGADTRHAQLVVDEITTAGGEAVANYDDVADWEGGQRLVNQAVETYGDVNVLVNNAGILRDRMSFNMGEEDWDAVIGVHLKGHFGPSRFAAAYWREKGKAGEEVYGRIVNTSSEAGLYGNAGQLNYAAAKAGIAAMTIVLARELEKYGVTVNAIAPRARTRMTERTFEGFGSAEKGEFDEMHPDNVAPLVGFLASPAAADVSGQVFVVWAGHVRRMGGWSVESQIDKRTRWTIDELAARKSDLFGADGGKIPPMTL